MKNTVKSEGRVGRSAKDLSRTRF